MHAFIDESGRKGSFMMCAATVTNGDVTSLKGELNRIRPKGSSRIHMKNVGKDAGRIVKAVAELDAHSYLFVVKKKCATRVARDMALTGTFTRLQELGTTRAVIESCSQDSEDRRVIRSVLGGSPTMEYIHEPAGSGNPLLWIPDVHAWAWGRGGTFKSDISHRITVEYL
ncbi:UNVERIFIED_ORG: hypothetical protein M2328_006779 [Rhodococcus erythropolis]